MKTKAKILALILCFILMISLCACGEDPSPQDPDNNGGNNNPPVVDVLPTADEIVSARSKEVEKTNQDYDFSLNLSGTLNISGYSGTANANYNGKYRYNSSTGDVKFYRETSGILLYDSKEYIYTQNDNKLKVVLNDRDEVKKVSAIPADENGLTMINLPFVSIVNALKASNLSNIKKNEDVNLSQYKYCAQMAFASDNPAIQTLLDKVANLGTNVDIAEVSFVNPQGGISLYFNLNDGHLHDFAYSFSISFPVKGVDATLKIEYKQKASSSVINAPSVDGFITNSSDIADELTTIENALNAIKESDTYSVDMTAKNDFDTGWNKNAIVDSYVARLYKNTNDDRVDFNHSYKFKAHDEEDGQEAYKYTIGNIQDGSVHEVSRRGSNVITALDGVTVDSQFDYLTSVITGLKASDIACIKKSSDSDGTHYSIHINNAAVKELQDKIVDIINSNNADGVVEVNNYFNLDNDVKDAYILVTIKNGKIVSANCVTELRYYPLNSADYEDCNVTLKNEIIIEFDKNLDKALEYKAPKGTNTVLGSFGLNNSKFYIL